MNLLAKAPHYRRIAAITLIALIACVVLAVNDKFPPWSKEISTNGEIKHPSLFTMATTVHGASQPNTPSSNKAHSAKWVPDIFAVRTWEPPAPVLPRLSSPPPVAPPLPFKIIGRIDDPQKGMSFFLTRGNELLQVSVGDIIDGIYRVDKYENGQLYFFYQPLNIRQSLFVGSDS